jgi:hypothetical protein
VVVKLGSGLDSEPGQVYWLDKLSGMSVLRVAALVAGQRKTRSHRVRYLASTGSGTRLFDLLRFGCRLLGFRLQAEYRDHDLYDLNGLGESAFDIDLEVDTIQNRVAQKVVDRVDVTSLLYERLRRPYSSEKLNLFLRLTVAEQIYEQVRSLSVLQRLAGTDADGIAYPGTLVVRRSPFSGPVVAEHLSGEEHRIATYFDSRSVLRYPRAAMGLARQLAIGTLNATFLSRRWSSGNPPARPPRPRIAISHTQGVDIGTRSDIIWYPDSGLSPDQVLVYFGRRRFPVSDAAIGRLKGLGLPWVILSDWRPGRRDTLYLKQLLGTVALSLRLALFALIGRSSTGWWQLRVIVDLERRVTYWSTFLIEHGASVHLHQVASSANAVPMVFAAERAGAIDVSYQWSGNDFIYATRGRTIAHHVFFAWGPLFASMIEAVGMAADQLLVGGSIFDVLAERRREQADVLESRMRASAPVYVICLFDSSFQKFIHQTPSMMAEFYEVVLRWVLRTSSVGLLIKPKAAVPRSLSKVGALVDQLIAEGRCVVLDADVSSFEAAVSADVVIGIGMNTAVLDAAVAGVPAVHFDLPGMAKVYHGLEAGADSFVFNDSAKLFAAVEAHKASGGKTTLGDHGSWLDSVDPFQDGGAARRLGTYLRWFLEAVEAGRESQQALAEATERYSREVGPQYVMTTQGQGATANNQGLQ